jgi:biofilm protein TabA
MKNLALLFLASPVFIFMGCAAQKSAANPATWTEAEASKWFNSKEWLGGSRLTPDPSINKKEFAIRYHQHKDWWDKAFRFLDTANIAAMPLGDHDLVGKDVFVRVSEYPTKNTEDAFYEAHQIYTDVHEVVSGTELIGTTSGNLPVKTPYNAERDITFYTGTDNKTYVANPGTFFIFFPGEFHRPSMKVTTSVPVRKVVVKIKN